MMAHITLPAWKALIMESLAKINTMPYNPSPNGDGHLVYVCVSTRCSCRAVERGLHNGHCSTRVHVV